ncbi:MAG: methyltransferase domain-containing protein [bacterium]
MTWYKDWFGQDYLKVYPHRDEQEAKKQVDFVEKIVPLQSAQRILDLGCGSGRHALELTRRGHHITCLDLSSVLLRLAREKSGGDDCCIRFVQADMRYIPFSNAFDVILSFFTTFGYFRKDSENLQTLVSIQEALTPGGKFLQDYLNKTFVVENLIPFDSRQANGFEIIQERRYNRSEERIEKKITLKENGKTREYFESVRLYTLEEMKQLLRQTKLNLECTFGDFDGSPFTKESPRLILVGRKESSL